MQLREKCKVFQLATSSELFRLVTTTLLPPLDMRKNENVEVFFRSMFVLKTREITENAIQTDIRYQKVVFLLLLLLHVTLGVTTFPPKLNRDCNLPNLLPFGEDLKSSSAAGKK